MKEDDRLKFSKGNIEMKQSILKLLTALQENRGRPCYVSEYSTAFASPEWAEGSALCLYGVTYMGY